MADAGDLKSPSRKGVLVRVQPPAPKVQFGPGAEPSLQIEGHLLDRPGETERQLVGEVHGGGFDSAGQKPRRGRWSDESRGFIPTCSTRVLPSAGQTRPRRC